MIAILRMKSSFSSKNSKNYFIRLPVLCAIVLFTSKSNNPGFRIVECVYLMLAVLKV